MSVALEAASVEVAEASAEVTAEHAKVTECDSIVATLIDEQKKTQNAKKKLEKAKAALETEKGKYIVIEESFTALMNGTWDTDKEAQKSVNKLMRDLQKFGAEDTLINSARTSLLKRPSDRQNFDTVICDTVKDFISNLIKNVEVKLSENESETAELEKRL